MRQRPGAALGGRARGIDAARAASIAVFVTFLLSGFNFAGWAARLPAVRDALQLSPNEMGLLLLFGAVFSLTALPLSGWVVQLLGARRTVQISASLNTGGLILAAAGVASTSVSVTAVGLAVYGVGTGVWDAAMNLEGAAAEQLVGRSLMPRFHAGFSFGTMAGAGVGAIAAWLHVPVVVHLGVALTLSLAAVLWATRSFLPEGTHDAHTDLETGKRAEGAFAAWRERRTILIGLVVLAAALTEGAANDWVSLAVVDGFDLPNAIGALSFAVFVTAMTGMRLAGTALLDRWGRVLVLRLAAALSLMGLLIFGLVPWFWLALVGIVAWGMGAALGFPVGMSAAADDPRRAPGRVAVVSTVGYSAFLAGPPLLGMLAEHVGYRNALLAITVPVVVGLFVATAARPLPGRAAGQAAGGMTVRPASGAAPTSAAPMTSAPTSPAPTGSSEVPR